MKTIWRKFTKPWDHRELVIAFWVMAALNAFQLGFLIWAVNRLAPLID